MTLLSTPPLLSCRRDSDNYRELKSEGKKESSWELLQLRGTALPRELSASNPTCSSTRIWFILPGLSMVLHPNSLISEAIILNSRSLRPHCQWACGQISPELMAQFAAMRQMLILPFTCNHLKCPCNFSSFVFVAFRGAFIFLLFLSLFQWCKENEKRHLECIVITSHLYYHDHLAVL